ncbi:unannotated protein [freshwater metagenome]|uniref:Unannotated protein n=1 Tax=freshwater metagenome TaxID=449393 RepID=A0A6J7KXP8_9ZZZZ
MCCVLIGDMNIGPSGKSSWLEIGLAIFFVLLVFGVFLFAFAAPLVSYFVTRKERWPDYTKKERIRIIASFALTVGTAALLIWLTTSPFTKS